ncbi:nucleotidyltransferase domain-containing protein [Chitinimonas taiwanensis]|uniref:Uncharacterized nucleotidyltransferase n=1 Tax=Chitinimonas taiwanensis DSM 18899 TaxID=1121279 RepID=A0A1K2HEA0_9NEIS|nr:nucleotidyltransferase family protein [Chitinimonas taiwanensis]SFZ74973.1 Uncharacterised nucleotidyltransferase [Chitinimonas taiwanensis DSM 18899]
MKVLEQLCQALLDPSSVRDFQLADWDRVLRVADTGLLTASLAERLEAAKLLGNVPMPVQARLQAAQIQCQANRRAVAWEVSRLERALKPLDVPIVLLKGSAYALADLPAGRGRLFGDIDILVPRSRLDEVEACLYWHGWIGSHHDAYDERYYREWMHELPALMHQKRQSVLDIHHTILPPTARFHPDPAKLHGQAVPVPGQDYVRMLAPHDMVLHSACHLFHESEWDKGLRDLYDLDQLLRHFATQADFYPVLLDRAREQQLQRPLFYALRYCQWLWQTPMPQALIEQSLREAAPPRLLLPLMDALFLRSIRPIHPLVQDWQDGWARFCLYVRGHWLRMPMHLLIPHLLRKAIKPYLSDKAPAGNRPG